MPGVAVEVAGQRRDRETICPRIVGVGEDVQPTLARGIGAILDVDVETGAVIPCIGSLVDLVDGTIAIGGRFRLEVELKGEGRSRARTRRKSQTGRVRGSLTRVVVGVGVEPAVASGVGLGVGDGCLLYTSDAADE